MTENELRTLVREAIARHLGAPPIGGGPAAIPVPLREHASHALCDVPAGADAGGPCLIEPSVMCTHCGYCKSYGH
jgi:hypothetical protein